MKLRLLIASKVVPSVSSILVFVVSMVEDFTVERDFLLNAKNPFIYELLEESTNRHSNARKQETPQNW